MTHCHLAKHSPGKPRRNKAVTLTLQRASSWTRLFRIQKIRRSTITNKHWTTDASQGIMNLRLNPTRQTPHSIHRLWSHTSWQGPKNLKLEKIPGPDSEPADTGMGAPAGEPAFEIGHQDQSLPLVFSHCNEIIFSPEKKTFRFNDA